MNHFLKSDKGMIKFIIRTIVLCSVLVLLTLNKQIVIECFNYNIFYNIQTYKLIWIIMVIIMLKSFFPRFSNKVASGKIFKKYYKASDFEIKKEQLKIFTHKSDIGALKSAIFFILQIILIGLLYYLNIISDFHLYLFSIILYWLDGLYMVIWCPYRSLFIKNKCCNSCRIYNWGYFMIVAPLIFINNFYTNTLVIISFLIIVKWEIMHSIKPERFSEITNEKLRCGDCLNKNGSCKNKNL